MLILKDFLPYKLSVLSNRISRAISDYYHRKYSLTLSEWRTMAVLGEQAELSAAEVAERTAMDKVAISRAVKNLLEAGHIERHFSPEDRRRSVLALSEQGRNIYDEVVPHALAYEKVLLDKLTDEEREFLNSILLKLSDIQLSNH